MTKLRASMVLGAALLAGSVATASAADLHRGSIKDGYVPAAPMASSGPSWYLRIDGSHTRFDDPGMVENNVYDLHSTAIDNAWMLGGGIGHYFSKSVRGDITWDHMFETDARGTIGLAPAPFPGGTRNFGMKSDVVLANLYYDIDTRSRFTPYIGVGLGAARNVTTTGTVADICGCTGTIAGDTQWSVAGALMGGFSVAMRDRLHLDAGYRYLYLGEAHTGVITGTGVSAGTNSGDPAVKDIWSHQFRVGLRWDIR